MKYIHPDVLDNGPNLIRTSAIHTLLLPDFYASMTYAEAVASSLLSVVTTSADFTMSSEGSGRKLVFGGALAVANKGIAAGAPLHIAHTDGAGRILWVDEESSRRQVIAGQNYRLPQMTMISPQVA